jgi:uncharacterized protein (DUF1501 family)
MKRRQFLRNTIAGVVLPSFFNGISLKALAGAPHVHALHPFMNEDRVLVLIQLSGGNDGINTVIPVDQYTAYTAARPNIFIPQDKVLPLTGSDATAFNPAMPQLQQLFNDGKLGVVQAVSYPKPNFSHFRATDIWMTGSDSDKVVNSGWAGRFLDQLYPEFPEHYPNTAMPDPLAIQVGAVVSTTLQGPMFTMGMAISNPQGFYKLVEGKVDVNSNTRWGEQLDYIELMSRKTDQYANVIKQAALKVTTQSPNYPATGKNPLADQLKIVARLIAGGLKTKVYIVSTGSFDTHAKQTETDTTTGTHAKLLQRVSEAIGVFMNDLQFEFGRRIKSNASGGTDHGVAAPVFYFGHAVKQGIVGANPVIPTQVTVKDNVPMQHDFRSLYASVLQNWFGLQPQDVQNILMGSFPVLPIV